jgi:hypothetical protein
VGAVNNCALAILVKQRAVIQVAEGYHALASLVRRRVIALGYGGVHRPRAISGESSRTQIDIANQLRVDFA